MWKVIIGTLSSLVAGLVAPLFGFLIMKILSEMMFAQYAGENVLAATGDWTLMMVAAAILIMIAKASSVINFSGIGQNIIKNVRKELYSSILHKEIGWHDDSTNGSGVLTATLASDVSTLNGVSSEGRAAQIEAMAALMWGLILGFIFSWPMALVGLGIAPFLVFGTFISQKVE